MQTWQVFTINLVEPAGFIRNQTSIVIKQKKTCQVLCGHRALLTPVANIVKFEQIDRSCLLKFLLHGLLRIRLNVGVDLSAMEMIISKSSVYQRQIDLKLIGDLFRSQAQVVVSDNRPYSNAGARDDRTTLSQLGISGDDASEGGRSCGNQAIDQRRRIGMLLCGQ